MTKVIITAGGAEKLREQLHHLKTVKRPRIIKEIEDARSHGDISENAEFHAAKEQQGFIEGRRITSYNVCYTKLLRAWRRR